MAEMVIGEQTTLEDMGGARMHATVSGCGDNLVESDTAALLAGREYLSYFPQNSKESPADEEPTDSLHGFDGSVIPEAGGQGYDIHRVIDALVDAGSFFEIKPLWATELVVGWARMAGMSVGIVANDPACKGGVLFVDSADKVTRFINCADAFNIPLVFLADVPGFRIGREVEWQGIIRHGPKMITAVAEATVVKISVILRKAYGAGLYAMAGPAFSPDATLRTSFGENRSHGTRGGCERNVCPQDRRNSGYG